MKYAKIMSYEEAVSMPEDKWQMVCKRSSPSGVKRQGCIRKLKRQEGCIVFTGGLFARIKELRSVGNVYRITLILNGDGEHHASLGQYFDIYLVPEDAVP